MGIKLHRDKKNKHFGMFVDTPRGTDDGPSGKTVQRRFCSSFAITWLRFVVDHLGMQGAVIFDIDDTLIDGNQTFMHGFEFMKEVYALANTRCPIHIVTARPDYDKAACLQLLAKRGLCIPCDRLHMLPGADYDLESSQERNARIKAFKNKCYTDIAKKHGVLARFGDKMWDVARTNDQREKSNYLSQVRDRDCYIFSDPLQKHSVLVKLPGAE